MTRSQIEPRLFDLLDEYSAAIADGAIKPARTSKAITFLQSFFEQLWRLCCFRGLVEG